MVLCIKQGDSKMKKTLLMVALAAAVAITALMVPILIGMDNTFAVDVPAETAPDTAVVTTNTAAAAPEDTTPKYVTQKPTPAITTFTDKRDGKTYKRVEIGGQVWMAENLNYAAEGSKCYNNSPDNCAEYGRLYNWKTALTACPVGTHLPSDAEWTTLTDNVGGINIAGTRLKSTRGWNNNGNGTDDYGFSALPGGHYSDDDDNFHHAGNDGQWWSATKNDILVDGASVAWIRDMDYNTEEVGWASTYTTSLLSVRCVRDSKEGEQ